MTDNQDKELKEKKKEHSNKKKSNKSFGSSSWGMSFGRRTQSGGVDGRSIRGGAKAARAREGSEKMSSVALYISSIPFIAGIAYFTFILFDIILLPEDGSSFSDYLVDVWAWLSLVAFVYAIFNFSRSVHAMFSLIGGFVPALLVGTIWLIGLFFR